MSSAKALSNSYTMKKTKQNKNILIHISCVGWTRKTKLETKRLTLLVHISKTYHEQQTKIDNLVNEGVGSAFFIISTKNRMSPQSSFF